jgi:hypothetical protein
LSTLDHLSSSCGSKIGGEEVIGEVEIASPPLGKPYENLCFLSIIAYGMLVCPFLSALPFWPASRRIVPYRKQ